MLSRRRALSVLNVDAEFRGLHNSRLVVALKIIIIVVRLAESCFGLGGESAGYLVMQRTLLHLESRPRSGAGIAARAACAALQGECFAEEWAKSWYTSGDNDDVLFDTTASRVSEQETIKDASSKKRIALTFPIAPMARRRRLSSVRDQRKWGVGVWKLTMIALVVECVE